MRHHGTAVASLLALVLGAAACGSDDQTPVTSSQDPASQAVGDVTVFAAASLTEAFGAVGDAFLAVNPDASVTFNFAGSSELVAQIVQGAPADVFASAAVANMTDLADAAATAGDPVVFAHNRSEIVVAPGNPLAIGGVADLADPDLTLVTCAPEVPCGTYAAQIFARAGIAPEPDSYEANVKAVVTKVVLGEADAGIAYATDIIAAGDDASGVAIPDEVNVVAEYPMVVTAESTNPTGGAAFVEFVLGDDGQQILRRFGFSSP